MRVIPALLLLPLCINCITAALHEAAFPEGLDYEYALDANTVAAVSDGYRVCFQTAEGQAEVRVRRIADPSGTARLPLDRVRVDAGFVWEAETVRGCSIAGVSGAYLPVGTLFFSKGRVPLESSRRGFTQVFDGQPESIRLSVDGRQIEIQSTGQLSRLRIAMRGEYGPAVLPYTEDEWISACKQDCPPADRGWKSLEFEPGGRLAVYYYHPDGRLRLKAFDVAMPENTVIYIPHVSSRPADVRYYLLPLYPFAVLLDAMTLVLQVTVWYDETRRTMACFDW